MEQRYSIFIAAVLHTLLFFFTRIAPLCSRNSSRALFRHSDDDDDVAAA